MFISETGHDRAIFNQIFGPEIIRREICTFLKKNSLPIFGGHLEFLRNIQKHVYLGNGDF